MSTRSLGSLTLDLIARVGGFKSGMDQAARIADNRSRDIKNSVSRNVSAGFDSANQSIQGFARNIIGLSAAWQGLSSGLAAADTWTSINNRIKLVTDGTEEFKTAQQGIIGIAQETRQSLTATAELYQRIATNQKELGLSGQEVVSIVETISKAMVVSGASAQGAEAALVQLGQAFASGTLRGEELNSVLEQAPALAKAIADGMGTTVGQLRTLSQAGELSAQAVIEALQNQAEAVDDSFAKMAATVGQSFQVLKNSATVAVGQFSEATGAANALASAVLVLGNNLPIAAAAFGSFASVQIARNLSERVKAMAANRVELIASTKAELAKAQAVELSTRAAMLNAQAEARRAQSIGGSVSLNAQAAAATLAHRQAVVQLTAAQTAAASATNVLGGALKSTMAFLGGPLGIGLMVASVAASWLMFRDNSDKANAALIDFNGTLDDSIAKFKELNRQQQAGEMRRIAEESANNFNAVAEAVREMQAAMSGTVSFEAMQQFAQGSNELLESFKSGKITADQFSQGIADLRAETNSASTASDYLRRKLDESETEIGSLSREYQKTSGLIDGFRDAQNDAADAVDETTAALKRQEAALKQGQDDLAKFIAKIPEEIGKAQVAIVRAQKGEYAAIQAQVGQMTLAAGGVANLKPEDRAAINDYLNLQKQRIAAEEAARESGKKTRKSVKEDRDEFARLNAQMAERIALFGAEGEAARLAYQLENGELKKLTDAQKEALMVQARKIDQLNKEKKAQDELNEARKREVEEMLEWKSGIDEMLSRMEFENSIIGMSNDARQMATALRRKGIDVMAEENQWLLDLVRSYEMERKEKEQFIQAMDSVRSAGADFLVDFTSGAKSFKDSMMDALDSIHRRILQMIAEKLMDQLFGQQGTTGSGSGWGQAIGNIFSSFFGGGRAGGGSVQPYSMYRVNEVGMEMLSAGGRDYLLTGSQGGTITPHNRMRGGINQSINVTIAGRPDNRTPEQIARAVGRESQRGLARTGA